MDANHTNTETYSTPAIYNCYQMNFQYNIKTKETLFQMNEKQSEN